MKISNAEGHGQSACRKCNELGKYSWTWTSFLYKVEGFEGYYCWECAQDIKNNKGVQLNIYDYLKEDSYECKRKKID